MINEHVDAETRRANPDAATIATRSALRNLMRQASAAGDAYTVHVCDVALWAATPTLRGAGLRVAARILGP
jgi:hypothetical protein